MILLGIDPGTATTGYAIMELDDDLVADKSTIHTIVPTVLHECAVVSTPAGIDMHDRLQTLYSDLLKISKQFNPDFMVIERLFFNTNAKTAMTVGQARGVALLVAAHSKMAVFEYTALEAKKVLTGYGRADKKEMQEAVRNYMGLKEVLKPDDANDAVAMVICHLHKELFPAPKEKKKKK